jgi:hypothetical protein
MSPSKIEHEQDVERYGDVETHMPAQKFPADSCSNQRCGTVTIFYRSGSGFDF